MVPVRIDFDCPSCRPYAPEFPKGKVYTGKGKTDLECTLTVQGLVYTGKGKGYGKGYDQLVYKGNGWCISDVRWPTLTLTWLGLDSEGESDSCHEQSIHDRAVERLKEAKLGPEEDHEMGYNDDERWSVRAEADEAEADEAEGWASLAMGDTGGTYKGKVKGKGKSMAVDDDDKWERHKGKGNDGKGEEMIIRAPRKVQQSSWPCAWCNMEPHDAVWRPLDGATPFDTEERVCDACWKGVKGEGKGDKVKGEGKGKRSKPQGLLEDPVEDFSSDEGPSSDEGRKGKGGKLEKSKGKGKDGKLEKGKGTGDAVSRKAFLVDNPDNRGGKVWMDEEGWVVDGRRRWSKEWFLRMVRAGKLNGHELDWQGLIDADVVASVLLDEFCNNNEEYAGDDNEEHAGDVDGTDNTSDADTTLWAPTPDPEALDDELDSEPPRKCGRLV